MGLKPMPQTDLLVWPTKKEPVAFLVRTDLWLNAET